MHSSIVLLTVAAAVVVHGGPSTKEGKGYYDAAQSQPAYPAQSAPSYQQQPPVYYQPVYTPPQYALPNVDVNYCTVHATFPLVERKHHRHHRRDRRQVYGQQDSYGGVQQAPAAGYGQAPAASYPLWPSPFTGHHSRRYERQHCRYSAIFDQATCQTCCQIASAAAGTDTSQVTGALFVFDPKIDRDQYYDSKSKSDEHKDDKDDKRVLQCICCLPKPL